MRRIVLSFVLAVTSVSLASLAFAATCSSEADCLPGERCLKPQGWLTGLCGVGGVPRADQPGGVPDLSVLPGRTYGNPCKTNADCGLNAVCTPSAPGSTSGTCLPER